MSSDAGVTKEERDFIAEVIAEDKQRRTPRNHVATIKAAEFNDPAYNAESDARNAAELLQEVLDLFESGDSDQLNLLVRIETWLRPKESK